MKMNAFHPKVLQGLGQGLQVQGKGWQTATPSSVETR